jgi:hypothetical protein
LTNHFPLELEPLREIIISQQDALEKHIIELGQLCLHFTKMINKKKESSVKLIQEDRIPRSLHIKCELTTSPSYEDNPIFLECKQELQESVSNFIKQGLSIMKKWSIHNIKLLTKDRCNSILIKALCILEGLYSFWSDILGPITPPGKDAESQALLLLMKIFFTTEFCDEINDISAFFDTPKEEMLLISSKILTNNADDTHNLRRIELSDLNILNQLNKNQQTIITETLTNFEEILKATSIHLWESNLQKTQLQEATQQ